jgi:hypothetical protein
MGGGRRGGGAPEDSERGSRRKQVEQLLQQMEDNDTQAYLEAEKLLTEQQQPRARELVSQQREEQLKAREQMRERQ